jgi:hypothetical protein
LLAKIEELNISLASLRIENEKLLARAKELDVCNASISDLRNNNDILRAKIVELNSCKPSTSAIEHVTTCTRCRDINIDAIHDHMALIKQQNDHIAKLDAKIAEHDLENEKFKFARSMLYNGRRPGIPNHAFMYKGETSSSRQSTRAKLPKKKTPTASNDSNISFKTFDASYVLTNKSGKVVAKYVGGKHKLSKTCVWVSKVLVSNVKGPKTIWVPKIKN